MIRLFLRRVFRNKIYWLAVFSALVLLLCSLVYTDPATGERFTFLSLFYDVEMQNYLQYDILSLKNILMGYQIHNYLGMFAPIIVGIPCILNQRIERFVLFRGSKNGYFFSKYVSNLMLGGGILVLAQVLFLFTGIALVQWLALVKQLPVYVESFWDIYMAKRFWNIFCEGVCDALLGIVLAEFIRSKYLILCVPFVCKYFMELFVIGQMPFEMQQLVLPQKNGIVLAGAVLAGGGLVKVVAERRCDCGQK